MRLNPAFRSVGFALACLLYVACLVPAILFWGLSQRVSAPGPLQEERTLVISKGASLRQIAERLEAAGVIDDALTFRIVARVQGRQSSIQAGEYRFFAGETLSSVLSRMAQGEIYIRSLTIPEGYTSRQIVELLNVAEGLTGKIDEDPEEGALLPETYAYTYGQTREAVLTRMRGAMQDALRELWETHDPNLPFDTVQDAVILASIVEKETGISQERARVAGVFVNRLNKGMKLQSDPTVIYALTLGKAPLGRPLTRQDLQTDSLYNTYVYPGLPPGPIANPGRDSLRAVLKPEKHEYLYFVADGTGGHGFSKTLNGHIEKVAHWRKIRARASEGEKSPKDAELESR